MVEIALDCENSAAELKLRKSVAELINDEFGYTEDYDILYAAYAALLNKEYNIKTVKQDVLLEVHDNNWGECLESVIEDFGVYASHTETRQIWYDAQGELHEQYSIVFEEELSVEPETLDGIIKGELKISNFLDELKEFVDDLTPAIKAFHIALKGRYIDEDFLRELFGSYAELLPECW